MKKLGYEITTGKSGDWKWRVLDGENVVEVGWTSGSFQDAVDKARAAVKRLEK